jgi:hypothetical protein
MAFNVKEFLIVRNKFVIKFLFTQTKGHFIALAYGVTMCQGVHCRKFCYKEVLL